MDIERVLRAARGGDVICLRTGAYQRSGEIDLHDIRPARTVTLRSAPGATVHLGWLNIKGMSNVTIAGFHLDGGVSDTESGSGVVFSGNTISGLGGATGGFFFYADGGQQTDIKIIGNRMDHLEGRSGPGDGQCVTINGDSTHEHHFTVSSNICGPDIADHYLQVGGIDGLIARGNRFLGPPDRAALQNQFHNNVFQLFGQSDDIDFSGNVIRNTESRGQTILVQDGPDHDLRFDHNLFAEDRSCLTNYNCHSYAFSSCSATGMQFTYNTVIDSYWGVQLTNSGSGDGCGGETTGTRYTVAHNIFVRPGGKGGNPEIDYSECTRRCVFDYNVSDDVSARQAESRHHVAHWSPRWTDARSFRPVGLPFAAGYAAK